MKFEHIYVRQFFEPKFYAQACGEVFGFKVADALKYLGKSNKGMENALRSHIRHKKSNIRRPRLKNRFCSNFAQIYLIISDHPKSPFCLGKYALILPTNFRTTTVSNRYKTLKIAFSVIQRTEYVTYRKSELLLGIEIIVVLEHTILLHLRRPFSKTAE